MVFDRWYCETCEKWLTVGTVAPRGVMYRHLATARHKKKEAEKEAERREKNGKKA